MRASGSETNVKDFSAIAHVYDELVAWAPYQRWVDELEKRLRRWGLEPGDWILDAACGTGLSTLPWAGKGYHVVGTDASGPMLELARERARRTPPKTGTVELKRQNLLALAPGREFDAAICMHSGLDYVLELDDLKQAFRSLRGCLVHGGLLAFDKCLDEPSFYRDDYRENRKLSCGTVEFLYRWDRTRKLFEQRCTVVRTDGRGPARTEVVFLLKAIRPDELTAMVEEAGFRELEPTRQFTIPDPGMGIFRAV